MSPEGDGTLCEIISGEVTSSVPLLGGKLASYLGGDVERTIHAEEAFDDAHLKKMAPAPRAPAPACEVVRTTSARCRGYSWGSRL